MDRVKLQKCYGRLKGLKDIVLVPYLANKQKIDALLEEMRDQDVLVLK